MTNEKHIIEVQRAKAAHYDTLLRMAGKLDEPYSGKLITITTHLQYLDDRYTAFMGDKP